MSLRPATSFRCVRFRTVSTSIMAAVMARALRRGLFCSVSVWDGRPLFREWTSPVIVFLLRPPWPSGFPYLVEFRSRIERLKDREEEVSYIHHDLMERQGS